MEKALLPSQPATDKAREWMLAVEAGDAAKIKSLLVSGTPADTPLGKGETALMRSAARGYVDIAQTLTAAGADVNARREDGFTPLILAVFFGHEEVVRLLLAAGADVRARTKLGTTAEKWAATRGFTEIVGLLKEAGAAPLFHEDGDELPRVEVEATRTRESLTDTRQETSAAPRNLPAEPRSLKDEAEAVFAASRAGAPREPEAATSIGREDSEVAVSSESANVERADACVVSESTIASTDGTEIKTALTGAAPPRVSRFGRMLQSWPVTAGAVMLIVASGVAVFTIQRGTETSSPGGPAAPKAAQPVVPQALPPAGDAAAQPSPAVAPEAAQPSPTAPFTAEQPNVFIYDPPPSTRGGALPSSDVPAVVSENGDGSGGGGRTTGNEPAGGRASEVERREVPPRGGEASAREGERVDDNGGAAPVAPSRTLQRTGVEARTQSPPPALVTSPAPTPTPAERRKVIQWP